MWKFCLLILKNLRRNRLRTTLTALAVLVLTLVYTVVGSTTALVNKLVRNNSSNTQLVVVSKWLTPSRLPSRYIEKAVSARGVTDWTRWHYYFGFLDESKRSDRFGLGIATRIENLQAMHTGLEGIDPRAIETLKRVKSGALVGQHILDNMKWRVGQRFSLLSATHPGKNLEFTIVGAMPGGKWGHNFFFRYDYFQQATGDEDTVNVIWLKVKDERTGRRVATEVERMFSNSWEEVKVETEAAGAARLAGKAESLMMIVNIVVLVLLVDMLVIICNSISISTRERRSEMAVLKVLGFPPNYIIAMVVAEALLIGALAGGLGAGLAYLACALNEAGKLPFSIHMLSLFPVPAEFVPRGILLGMLTGLLGSIVPAWNARKVKVTEVFSKIA